MTNAAKRRSESAGRVACDPKFASHARRRTFTCKASKHKAKTTTTPTQTQTQTQTQTRTQTQVTARVLLWTARRNAAHAAIRNSAAHDTLIN